MFKPVWLLVMQKIWWTKDPVVPLFSLIFLAAFSYVLICDGRLDFSICFGWYLKFQVKNWERGRDGSNYELLFPLKARLSHPIAEPSGNLCIPAFSPVKVVVCPVSVGDGFPKCCWLRYHLFPGAAWKFPPFRDFRLPWSRHVLHQQGQ